MPTEDQNKKNISPEDSKASADSDHDNELNLENSAKATPDYIDSLKKEVVKWRSRAKENKAYEKKFLEADERLKEAEEKASMALRRIDEVSKASEKRIIDAELKSLASEFGLKKLEYLKLGDLSQVKLDENGEIIGAREMIESLKNSDPDLFRKATTSNPTYGNMGADKKVVSEKKVLKLNPAEYEKAEREFLSSIR